MVTDDRTGSGMRDGKLLFIADVQRGLACGCVCARCRQPLVAKKGSIREHHFAHFEATSCHGAAESVLHSLAKELIAELDEFAVPPYEFVKQRRTKTGQIVRHEARVAKGGDVRIDKVRVEEHQGDFVPDIIIESGSKSLVVEVAVTHKVARAKLRKIRRRNLPVIEIKLDPSDSFLPRGSLKSKLRDSTSKVWLFHPDQREHERVFVSKFRALLVQRRTKLRQSTNPSLVSIPSPRSSSVIPSSSGSAYDRTAEEFNRKHGRYPTMEECLRLWPHLYKPSTFNPETKKLPTRM
jgi:hypothetical protein